MIASRRCKECGSGDLEWSWGNTIRNNMVQGRLTTNDVECMFYLGCNECSSTVALLPAYKVLPILESSQEPTND